MVRETDKSLVKNGAKPDPGMKEKHITSLLSPNWASSFKNDRSDVQDQKSFGRVASEDSAALR